MATNIPADLDLAVFFHETYERLAPSFGYETRLDTKRFDSESKNGRLMMAVCAEVREHLKIPDETLSHSKPAIPPSSKTDLALLDSIANWFDNHPNVDLECGGIELLRQYRDGLRAIVVRSQFETAAPRPVVYSHCAEHMGQAATMWIGAGAAPIVICPVCNPPPMHPMKPLGDSVRNAVKTPAPQESK